MSFPTWIHGFDSDFAATVARFDAAPDAEESLRERVAQAMVDSVTRPGTLRPTRVIYTLTDAAIAVMRGQS